MFTSCNPVSDMGAVSCAIWGHDVEGTRLRHDRCIEAKISLRYDKTDSAIESITLEHVQRYCDRPAKMVYHGQRIRPYSIRKELRTFRQTWLWGFRRGHVRFAPSWEIPVDQERRGD